jgi:hypothetical protein
MAALSALWWLRRRISASTTPSAPFPSGTPGRVVGSIIHIFGCSLCTAIIRIQNPVLAVAPEAHRLGRLATATGLNLCPLAPQNPALGMPHGVVRSGRCSIVASDSVGCKPKTVAIPSIMLAAESRVPPDQNTPLSPVGVSPLDSLPPMSSRTADFAGERPAYHPGRVPVHYCASRNRRPKRGSRRHCLFSRTMLACSSDAIP